MSEMPELKDIRRDIREIEEVASQIKNADDLSPSEKKKLLTELKNVRRKLKIQEQREMAIFTDEPHYGKAPTKFLRDPRIPLQPKAIFSIMHTYANPKEFILNPKTFVSLKTLMKDTGMKRTQLIYWINFLEEQGWLTKKRRGMNMSNNITLHWRKRYKKDKR